jgi:hypothetical protein
MLHHLFRDAQIHYIHLSAQPSLKLLFRRTWSHNRELACFLSSQVSEMFTECACGVVSLYKYLTMHISFVFIHPSIVDILLARVSANFKTSISLHHYDFPCSEAYSHCESVRCKHWDISLLTGFVY